MNREAEKQRLVELIDNFFQNELGVNFNKDILEKFAKHLLDKGVIVSSCETDDYVDDVAQDVFIEPIQLTMTNEEVEEVLERCRRRVVEESGCTDL